MKLKIVINPAAYGGKSTFFLSRVKQWLPYGVHEYSYEIPTTREELVEEIASSEKEGFDAVLVLGGDGTIHYAIKGILQTSLPLGYLPRGRGNDFARNIGMSLDLKTCCEGYANPTIREIDLPTVNGIPFANIASIGFDALVTRMAHDFKCGLPGPICYAILVYKGLIVFKPISLRIRIDDRQISGRYMLVAVANGINYGGGMSIAPNAVMDDGLFDVCLISEMSNLTLALNFPKVFKGKHLFMPQVEMFRAKTVEIESDLYSYVATDGEIVCDLPVKVEFAKRRLRILMPELP